MSAHDHSHAHPHPAPADWGRAFVLGIALNVAFIAIEVTCGVFANSVALLADAAHNASDALGLLVAWVGHVLASRRPTSRFTYGWRGSSIVAALVNALLLLVAVGGIAWEAISRLASPQPIASVTVIVVAAAGILVNGATAWLFAAGRHTDLNLRGAFLHMAADAAVSAGVVAGAILIMATGWMFVDPLLSLLIAAVIVWTTWGLLRDSLSMSLAAVPGHIDPQAVRGFLERLPGVASVHDLHIWPMSTAETALTAHLVMPAGHPGDAFLADTAHRLGYDFRINHVTLQIEVSRDSGCRLKPDHLV
jgi:cobalt-zinc-cadmium efflux system protein